MPNTNTKSQPNKRSEEHSKRVHKEQATSMHVRWNIVEQRQENKPSAPWRPAMSSRTSDSNLRHHGSTRRSHGRLSVRCHAQAQSEQQHSTHNMLNTTTKSQPHSHSGKKSNQGHEEQATSMHVCRNMVEQRHESKPSAPWRPAMSSRTSDSNLRHHGSTRRSHGRLRALIHI